MSASGGTPSASTSCSHRAAPPTSGHAAVRASRVSRMSNAAMSLRLSASVAGKLLNAARPASLGALLPEQPPPRPPPAGPLCGALPAAPVTDFSHIRPVTDRPDRLT